MEEYRDNSGDKKYFAIIPYVIINGYDATTSGVYAYIKRRCGENLSGKFREAQQKTSKKLHLDIKTYRKILKKLEKDNRIKFIGWQEGKTHPIKTYEIIDIWKENILAYSENELKRNRENTLLSSKKEKRNRENTLIRNRENTPTKKKQIEEERIHIDRPFDFKELLSVMKKDKRRHIQIIALYWRYKNFHFTNREQYISAIKRELRAAGKLIGYPDEEIIATMDWLEDNTAMKWTLETIHKYIDENLGELTPMKKNAKY